MRVTNGVRLALIVVLAACAAPAREPSARVPPSVAPPLAPGQTLVPIAAASLGATPSDPAVRLVANSSTVCALLASGGAACWGHGFDRPTHLWTDVTDLVMSEQQACVALRDRHAECGVFSGGQFVRHIRVDNIDQIALSRGAACARTGGDVACWRDGERGPFVPVPKLHGATTIAMAMLSEGVNAPSVDYGCALVAGGRVACFEVFATTPASEESSTFPAAYVGPPQLHVSAASLVPGLGDATAIDALEYDARLCATTPAGYRCAALDLGTIAKPVAADPPDDRACRADGDDVVCSIWPKRVRLPHAHDFVSSRFACAIADGRVMCWGEHFEPVAPGPARGLDDAIDVAVRTDQVFAVRGNGQLVAWGPRLGHDVPTTLTSLVDVRAVATMDVRTCVLREGGRVSCVDDAGVVTDTSITGASELRATDFSIVAHVGDHWLGISTPADDKPRAVPIAGTDGADDVALGFTWTCARRGSALRCWSDLAHPIAIDGPVTAFALAAADADADLAVLRPGGHADAVRLSGGKVASVEPLAAGVRAVFGTAGPACVATTTELVCGRFGGWQHTPLAPTLANTTRLAFEDTACGLVDHHVVCASEDTWLLGSGAAISETPVRVVL